MLELPPVKDNSTIDAASSGAGLCPMRTSELIDRVLKFTEICAGSPMYKYQYVFSYRLIESVLDNDGAVITALWSRQSGKSEAIARVCFSLGILLPVLANLFPNDPRFVSFKNGFLIGIYAPVEDQATRTYDRIRNLALRENTQAILHDPEINVTVVNARGDLIKFSHGSRIIAHTASEKTDVEGETHHLLICEEAQKMSQYKVDKELRPMLSSTNGTTAKIGTAWESRGGFHLDIQTNVENQLNGGKRNHFEFDYQLVCDQRREQYMIDKNPHHLKYEKWVLSERDRLGADSIEFKMNFRLLWNEMRVIAISENTINRNKNLKAELVYKKTGLQIGGLDLGKKNDRTVLTVGEIDLTRPYVEYVALPGSNQAKRTHYPKQILNWLELEGAFEGSSGQYQNIVAFTAMFNLSLLVVDATSMQDVIFERLNVLLGSMIILVPFTFSLSSKSELFKHYLQEQLAGRVQFPFGPVASQDLRTKRYMREHLSLDRTVNNADRVMISAPIGEHDDYPASGALMCHAEIELQSRVRPSIEVVNRSVTNSSGGRSSNRYARRGGIRG